jgi:hypothetical protein
LYVDIVVVIVVRRRCRCRRRRRRRCRPTSSAVRPSAVPLLSSSVVAVVAGPPRCRQPIALPISINSESLKTKIQTTHPSSFVDVHNSCFPLIATFVIFNNSINQRSRLSNFGKG